MDDTVDLLQIKIERAKAQLSDETLNAINAVDWQTAILKLRDQKGYSFEQLGDLETETELVLCGLLNPKDYPQELEKRLNLNNAQVNELVNEMNQSVFSKIKDELIKNTERKKIFAKTLETSNRSEIPIHDQEEERKTIKMLGFHGIEIISDQKTKETPKTVEKKADLTVPELEAGKIPPSPSQGEGQGVRSFPPRLSATPEEGNSSQSILQQKLSGSSQTGIVKTEHSLDNITKTASSAPYPPKGDPYRLPPE